MNCNHVQYHWLNELSWKLQTVINQGMRAPDTHFCKGIKNVCRWIRTLVLQNADSKHTFMCVKEGLPTIEDIENELNYCSVHFATHFLYALEIIAYTHPDAGIRQTAMNYYRGVVHELWHFNLETKEQMFIRLSDVDRPVEPPKCPKNDSYDSYLR